MKNLLVREFNSWDEVEMVYEVKDTKKGRAELIAAEEGMRMFDRDIVHVVRENIQFDLVADIYVQ